MTERVANVEWWVVTCRVKGGRRRANSRWAEGDTTVALSKVDLEVIAKDRDFSVRPAIEADLEQTSEPVDPIASLMVADTPSSDGEIEAVVPNDLDRGSSIIRMIAKLGEADFSRDGKPKVKSIESLTGWQLTAAERDRAWELIERFKALPEIGMGDLATAADLLLVSDLTEPEFQALKT